MAGGAWFDLGNIMKKRGLGDKRGLDALMGNIKKERRIATDAGALMAAEETAAPVDTKTDFSLLDDEQDIKSVGITKKKPKKKSKEQKIFEYWNSHTQPTKIPKLQKHSLKN